MEPCIYWRNVAEIVVFPFVVVFQTICLCNEIMWPVSETLTQLRECCYDGGCYSAAMAVEIIYFQLKCAALSNVKLWFKLFSGGFLWLRLLYL